MGASSCAARRRSAAVHWRRPWASAAPRFTLSTLDLTEDSSYNGFIERTRIAIENGDGDDAIRLPGCVIGITWGSFQRRQEQLVARCEAIWLWGAAHGATRETGRYLPLANEGMQDERETLERRIGLVVPHRGQVA